MLLLIGLGNPGPEYQRNRHNVGFAAVDAALRRYGFGNPRSKFAAVVHEGRIGNIRVLALKPQTFMNESGRAVGAAMHFYSLTPADVIVIHDELDLAPGKVRAKTGGGHAGHNGLRSIDDHIGRNYQRVRIGIGHPGDKQRVTGHVLDNFARTDYAWVRRTVGAVAEALPLLIAGDEAGFIAHVAFQAPPPKQPNPAVAEQATPEREKPAGEH